MSELQFLQAKSDLGSMIFVSGSITSTANTVIISYTPATGNTFVIVSGSVVCDSDSTAVLTGGVCQLRNNTSVREYLSAVAGLISGGTPFTVSPKTVVLTKGDTLIGNGVLTYDLFQLTAFGTSAKVYGSIQGYLE